MNKFTSPLFLGLFILLISQITARNAESAPSVLWKNCIQTFQPMGAGRIDLYEVCEGPSPQGWGKDGKSLAFFNLGAPSPSRAFWVTLGNPQVCHGPLDCPREVLNSQMLLDPAALEQGIIQPQSLTDPRERSWTFAPALFYSRSPSLPSSGSLTVSARPKEDPSAPFQTSQVQWERTNSRESASP